MYCLMVVVTYNASSPADGLVSLWTNSRGKPDARNVAVGGYWVEDLLVSGGKPVGSMPTGLTGVKPNGE